MAKGKKKETGRKSKQEEVENGEHKVAEEMSTPANEESGPDPRAVEISVDTISKFEGIFSLTDVYVEVRYRNEIIGTTKLYPVIDHCVEINEKIDFHLDAGLPDELDEFIKNPFYFTVWQCPRTSPEIFHATSDLNIEMAQQVSSDSILSKYDYLLGIKPVIEEEVPEEKPDKKKKKGSVRKSASSSGKKGKGKNKTPSEEKKMKSKKSLESTKDKKSKGSSSKKDKKGAKRKDMDDLMAHASDPVMVGNCNCETTEFFIGATSVTGDLEIHQTERYTDDNLVTKLNLPILTVTLSIDKPLFDEDRKLGNVITMTIESMYNVPAEYTNYKFSIATLMPSLGNTLKPVVFTNGVYTEYDPLDYIKWSTLLDIHDDSCFSKYRVEEAEVKTKMTYDIKAKIKNSEPRVQWNTFQWFWLMRDYKNLIKNKLTRYRCWPFEIYLEPEKKKGKGKGDKDSKGSKGSKGSKESKSSKESKKSSGKSGSSSGKGGKGKRGSKDKRDRKGGINFMCLMDVSRLLYPGVTKLRAAGEIRTYNDKEISDYAGIEESFFMPRVSFEKSSGVKSRGKSTKASKGGGDKKKDKERKKTSELFELEVEGSTQLFNEEQEPTFLVINFELLEPFTFQRSLDDLTEELNEILPKRPPPTKISISIRDAEENYQRCIRKITEEINKQYNVFINKYSLSQNDMISRPEMQRKFIEFLHGIGDHQKYMTTLSSVIAVLVNEKHWFDDKKKNVREFENHISLIYRCLVEQMNTVLNTMICGNNEDTCIFKPSCKSTLIYCQEAIEMKALLLAERYYTENTVKDPRNPDNWLNYAIYLMEQNNIDLAYECVQEALALKINHKYSLLLFAVILDEKRDYYLAETAFLTLLQFYPRFLPGWTSLYLFYRKKLYFEGMDTCLDLIEKIQQMGSEDVEPFNFLQDCDDLTWTTELCHKDNPFFVTGMLLIKLRALKFADFAISTECFTKNGELEYYKAVIHYLRAEYDDALERLDIARKLHGNDFAANSLLGHCYMRLEKYEDAQESYEYVVESFNHPEDMHMLYFNLAYIHQQKLDYEKAKNYLLHIVKLSPTPLSWLTLGIVYYYLDEYRNAEKCFQESNSLDKYICKTWAYLTLINIKMKNKWVAEQCFKNAIRQGLAFDPLYNTICNEIAKL